MFPTGSKFYQAPASFSNASSNKSAPNNNQRTVTKNNPAKPKPIKTMNPKTESNNDHSKKQRSHSSTDDENVPSFNTVLSFDKNGNLDFDKYFAHYESASAKSIVIDPIKHELKPDQFKIAYFQAHDTPKNVQCRLVMHILVTDPTLVNSDSPFVYNGTDLVQHPDCVNLLFGGVIVASNHEMNSIVAKAVFVIDDSSPPHYNKIKHVIHAQWIPIYLLSAMPTSIELLAQLRTRVLETAQPRDYAEQEKAKLNVGELKSIEFIKKDESLNDSHDYTTPHMLIIDPTDNLDYLGIHSPKYRDIIMPVIVSARTILTSKTVQISEKDDFVRTLKNKGLHFAFAKTDGTRLVDEAGKQVTYSRHVAKQISNPNVLIVMIDLKKVNEKVMLQPLVHLLITKAINRVFVSPILVYRSAMLTHALLSKMYSSFASFHSITTYANLEGIPTDVEAKNEPSQLPSSYDSDDSENDVPDVQANAVQAPVKSAPSSIINEKIATSTPSTPSATPDASSETQAAAADNAPGQVHDQQEHTDAKNVTETRAPPPSPEPNTASTDVPSTTSEPKKICDDGKDEGSNPAAQHEISPPAKKIDQTGDDNDSTDGFEAAEPEDDESVGTNEDDFQQDGDSFTVNIDEKQDSDLSQVETSKCAENPKPKDDTVVNKVDVHDGKASKQTDMSNGVASACQQSKPNSHTNENNKSGVRNESVDDKKLHQSSTDVPPSSPESTNQSASNHEAAPVSASSQSLTNDMRNVSDESIQKKVSFKTAHAPASSSRQQSVDTCDSGVSVASTDDGKRDVTDYVLAGNCVPMFEPKQNQLSVDELQAFYNQWSWVKTVGLDADGTKAFLATQVFMNSTFSNYLPPHEYHTWTDHNLRVDYASRMVANVSNPILTDAIAFLVRNPPMTNATFMRRDNTRN